MIESVFAIADQFMDNPEHVTINRDVLSKVSDEIPGRQPLQIKRLPLPDLLTYELMAAAVNYCYWYGRHDVRPACGGASKMYEMLDIAWDCAVGFGDFEFDECFVSFKNLLAEQRFTLLEHRVRHLEEIEFQTEFILNLSDAIVKPEFDIDEWLTELCITVPGFGSDVFLKRACLFFMMVQRRTGIIEERQIRRLPIPADYQIPKMLRWKGVLDYSRKLSDLIANHELIPAGSLMECEIRAASIVACEQLAELSGKSMCEVDDYLWSNRHNCNDPFHLTVTTDY